MIEILRWFLGWSEFEIEGSVSEFLTKFKKIVWKVKKNKKHVYARCLTKDYKHLKKNAIYYGCFLTKLKNVGFLNFLKKYKFRYGLLVGFFVFFLALFISSFFVWNIEIFGNSLTTDEEIFNVCDKNGLHFGSFVFNVNDKDIEHKLKEKFPQISWVSLNRVAGKYLIEISELKEKPKILDWTGPCNVVSDFNGEILYIKAFRGLPLVEAGEFVEKGQVLVTGVQQTKELQDEVIYTPSEAEIVAKVKKSNQISLKKNSVIDQKTGNQKIDKKLCFFNLKIPLRLYKKNKNLVKVSENYKPLEFFKIRFPILIKTIYYDVFEKINLGNDVKDIKRILLKEQKKWEEKNLVDNIIISRQYSFKEQGETVTLKADVFVEQRIDKKVPLNLEEEEEKREKELKEKKLIF